MKDQQSEENESLSNILDQIDRMVAEWSKEAPESMANKVKSLTDYVNRIANAHGVIGGVFSCLDPERSIVVLAKNYLADTHANLSADEEKFRLFPYRLQEGIQKKFPRLFKALDQNKTKFTAFIDSLFTIQRDSHRLNYPKGSQVPEFLQSNLMKLKLFNNEEIRKHLTGWLYTLFCAANSKFGLQASDGTPVLNMSIGDAILKSIEKTPEPTRRVLGKFDIFNQYFEHLCNESTGNLNPTLEFLLDCNLEDIVPEKDDQKDFARKAQDFFIEIKLDRTLPFVTQLEAICEIAPFPLIPYLCIVALFKKPIAHVVIPMHHTRSFQHYIIDRNDKSVARTCGVYFLGTVDETIVREKTLAAITKAMAAPILDQMYYGGFQKLLAQHDGQKIGVSQVQTAFGHQVKGLGQFYKYWLIKGEASKTASENLDDIQWTRVPELFEDLGKTLTFWAFGNKADDLCLEKEAFPPTLQEIISLAMSFVNHKERASYYARENFHACVDLAGAKSFMPITLVFNKNSEMIGLKSDCFYPSNSDIANLSWREFAGLCRYLSVLMENAFEYRPKDSKSQTVNVAVKIPEEGSCSIELSNDCIPKSNRDFIDMDKRKNFSGARGNNILTFIKEISLSSLGYFKVEEHDNDTTFRKIVTFTLPEWMTANKEIDK